MDKDTNRILKDEESQGAIPLEDAIDIIWKQLENKFGYDIRTIQNEKI